MHLIISASSKDYKTAGSDKLSLITTNSIVQGTSDSEILGTITTIKEVADNASSSEMLDSVIKSTSSPVPGTSDSDMIGSITTANQMVENASSDMLGSIKTTNTVVQGSSSSDMLGSITTTNPNVQDTSDSSGSIFLN